MVLVGARLYLNRGIFLSIKDNRVAGYFLNRSTLILMRKSKVPEGFLNMGIIVD